MVLSNKIIIKNKNGIHGFCWFAIEDIKEGEMLWSENKTIEKYHDITISIDVLNTWPKLDRDKFLSLAYMVSEGIYRGSDPHEQDNIPIEEQNEYYVNHSCDGNAWYEGADLLVAKRDIKAGEEICYDYALTETNPDWCLSENGCLCGTKKCRGKVTGNDWKLLPRLQNEYEGHFLPYINEMIFKFNKKTPL